MTKTKLKHWYNSQKYARPVVFIVGFAILGSLILLLTRAAGPFASIQPEGSTLSGTTKVSDANASGGSYLQFGSGTTTPPPPTNPPGTWPNDATTGYKACGKSLSQLTPKTGTLKPGDNEVIENFDLTGNIDVVGKNVIIRCGRIRTAGDYGITSSNRVGSYVVDGVEIQGVSTSGSNSAAIVHYGTWTAKRVNVWRFRDGIKVGTNQTVEDSWIHDLWKTDGSHNDGFQSVGGSNVKILRNRIEGPYQSSTSALILGSDGGPLSNYTIDDNFLSGGGFTIYIGGPMGMPTPQNMKVRNNVFNGYTTGGCCGAKANDDTRNSWLFGTNSFRLNWPAGDPGAEWSGNTFIDGRTFSIGL